MSKIFDQIQLDEKHLKKIFTEDIEELADQRGSDIAIEQTLKYINSLKKKSKAIIEIKILLETKYFSNLPVHLQKVLRKSG